MRMMYIWMTYRPDEAFTVIEPKYVDNGIEGKYYARLASGNLLLDGIWHAHEIIRTEVV